MEVLKICVCVILMILSKNLFVLVPHTYRTNTSGPSSRTNDAVQWGHKNNINQPVQGCGNLKSSSINRKHIFQKFYHRRPIRVVTIRLLLITVSRFRCFELSLCGDGPNNNCDIYTSAYQKTASYFRTVCTVPYGLIVMTLKEMQYRPEDRVKVQLKVDKSLLGYPGSPSDYYVAVTGSGLQLGNNDPNIAPRCKQVGRNLWMKEIWPTKHSDIKFRFLVVKRSNNVIGDTENMGTRNLSIESKPIIFDVRFNKPRVTAKEIDEITRCNREPQYSRRGNSHASSIKANIRAHQNVRNQPMYSLKPNTQWKEPKLEDKLMPPISQRAKDESILIRKRQEEKLMYNTNERPTVTGESAATLTTNDSRPTKAILTCNVKLASTATAGDIPLTSTVMTSDAVPLTIEMVSNTTLMTATTTNNTPLITAATAGNTGSMTTDMAGYIPLMTAETATDIFQLVTTAAASNSSLITTSKVRDGSLITTPIVRDGSLITTPIARDGSLITTPIARDRSLITTAIARDDSLITTPIARDRSLITTPIASDGSLITTPIARDRSLITTPIARDHSLITTPISRDRSLITTPIADDIRLITTPTTSFTELLTTTTASDIPLMTTMMASNTKQTTIEAANTNLLTTTVSTIRSEEGINNVVLIRKNNFEATGKSTLCKEEESRRIKVESTSSEWRPSARALLLAAAGVAAATCVGYYYFVKND